jgi:transcriptional/translational regulatory protein YebC/TACO1
MVPNTTVTLTDQDDVKYMNRLIDMLEDNDDIQNVYNNWDMPDE